MRKDAIGFFWQDEPVVKESKAKVKEKREPPDRFWERDDYLPNWELASKAKFNLFTDEELITAQITKELLTWDIEVYPNYVLIAFKSIITKKVFYFELTETSCGDINKLQWILENFCIIGFNTLKFDTTIAMIVLAGGTPAQCWYATQLMIEQNARYYDVLKEFNLKFPEWNQIDLIEVAPLTGSLKMYGGRMHVPIMQDLPFKPGTFLSSQQIIITRWYCINDLDLTQYLYEELHVELEQRNALTVEYKIDVRSKSDAQAAEAIMNKEIFNLTGKRAPKAPENEQGTSHKYKVPAFIQFQTPLLQTVLQMVKDAEFKADYNGKIILPDNIANLDIPIADNIYRMGIGGLHSQEKQRTTIAGNDIIEDRDVTSYYPFIIILLGLFPKHLGRIFLQIFKKIVDRRIKAKDTAKTAKKNGDAVLEKEMKKIADMLKIFINGLFGKLGSIFSIVYSADLLIQVTITGQLCLLMLIEMLELCNISVVSANTDGVVSRFKKEQENKFNECIKYWEKKTGFTTEGTRYKMLCSRDVNNYIAITTDDEVKTKGAYGLGEKSRLSKNPSGNIRSKAVIAYLKDKIPIADTIKQCKDITDFVFVRHVNGGAIKDNQYLGKAVRWYYGNIDQEPIIYAKTGNKVPKSEGAKPVMTLPLDFPTDIDYNRYIVEAEEMLADTGY